MTPVQSAYEHYRAYCLRLNIRPATQDTYLKKTETLNKAPHQMPKSTHAHQPLRDQ